ncbi:MAG TPA: nucleoside phosphorylase [Aggregatilinea sp.]|uniref:nucleoside phosphorylase n=1 Tax=Aggregatilinea sp. TaxID=2806333 RepID=UPI002C3004A4|nr:nucleoside phosphorylase [Aggregatilinea sp.]HML21995.1 nucleoside phosphorylase [Aggregatilinea sp.]
MKESIKKLYDRYDFAPNVPLKGLLIDGKPALTGIDPARIGDYVILTVRDPLCDYVDDPAAQIAQHLENAELVARTGMFTTYTGTFEGARISIVSGGSGSPEAELVLHEFLENTDATTYVRVGGSGGMHESVRPGDVVISRGVVRDEGMTQAYISPSYPAAASYEVVMAFVQAAYDLGVSFHVGITRSSDSDFCGVGRPSVGGYMQPRHLEVIDYYRRAGVLNGDRESAAVVTLATLFGKRGGSICSVADNIVTGETFTAGAGHDTAIRVALKGFSLLRQMDLEKQRAGQDFWTPSLRGAGA